VSRRSAEAHARIVAEIVREKAATLGRAGERLEASLAAVAEIARAWCAADDAPALAPLPAAYERAWHAAEAARQTLSDPARAVGLRHHRDSDVQFPRPPRRL